jgi:hypothetical protein
VGDGTGVVGADTFAHAPVWARLNGNTYVNRESSDNPCRSKISLNRFKAST